MNSSTHRRRQHGEHATWPDTTMARAFLAALAEWAIAHHDDADARVALPIGIVGAEELLKVLRALAKARHFLHEQIQ